MSTPTTAQQVEALDNAIEHWTRIANRQAGEKERITSKDCKLCELNYTPPDGTSFCATCPIKLYTGVEGCLKTPWNYVYNQWISNQSASINEQSEEFYDAANDELNFLIKLRDIWTAKLNSEKKGIV